MVNILYNTCSTLNTGPYWRGFPSSGQKAGYLNKSMTSLQLDL